MRKTRGFIFAALIAVGCKSEPSTPPAAQGQVQLARAADGQIELQLRDVDVASKALQVEILVSGDEAYTIETVQPAEGLSLNAVRARMQGTNRAVVFVGDTRGVRLPTTGAVARFTVEPVSSSANSGARISLGSVLLVGPGGDAIPTRSGPSISAR